MKAFLIGLLIGPLLAQPIMAQCGTVYRARHHTPIYSAHVPYAEPAKAVVVKEIVKEVAYQAIIPVFQLEIRRYNTYGAVYLPPVPEPASAAAPAAAPTPQAAQAQAGELRQILELLQRQDARIRAIEERLGAGVSPKTTPKAEPRTDEAAVPDVRQIAARKCALCHQQGNESQGGKFILTDASGNLMRLPDARLLSLSDHVYGGTMPPQTQKAKAAKIEPLTDQEAGAFMREIARQRRLNAGG